MVNFDTGVIMGSAALSIFEDMVEMHPGSKKLYSMFKGHCSCLDPDCARRSIQDYLHGWCGDDKGKVVKLFEKIDALDELTYENLNNLVEGLYPCEPPSLSKIRLIDFDGYYG